MKSLGSSLIVALAALATLSAHPMTYKGTVVSVAETSLQVYAMDDMTKKESTITFKVNDQTKILRGETVVTFANARIQKDERIAVTVNMDTTPDAALVIRLAERPEAQAPATPARVDKTGSQTVTGCVARGTAGRYLLNSATIEGTTDGKSYDLQGGAFKAHLGHKVAVIGTVVPPKMVGHEGMSKEAMAKMRATLRVKSVKMIAATCGPA